MQVGVITITPTTDDDCCMQSLLASECPNAVDFSPKSLTVDADDVATEARHKNNYGNWKKTMM